MGIHDNLCAIIAVDSLGFHCKIVPVSKVDPEKKKKIKMVNME